MLRDQRDKILKGFSDFDDELDAMNSKQKEDPNTGKSLSDLIKEKREATEKVLEQSKPQEESLEERKKRLQAQRDLLLK